MEFQQIKELIEIFDKSSLCSLKLTQGECSLSLQKFSDKIPTISKPIPQNLPKEDMGLVSKNEQVGTVAEAAQISGDSLTSPMVGTFYRSPSPNTPAFVNVGDKVKKGQVLAIIEAMKIMNEIEADFDCVIKDILPSDGQPVEFGTPLFIVERI